MKKKNLMLGFLVFGCIFLGACDDISHHHQSKEDFWDEKRPETTDDMTPLSLKR